MNILMISLDSSAVTKGEHIGDFSERLAEYGKHLSNLFVVSYVPKGSEIEEKKIGENVFTYAAPSRSKLSFILNGYRKASSIIEKEKVDLITCQDPFLTGTVGYLLKRNHRIPLLIQLHRDSIENDFWIRDRIRNRFLNVLGKYILRKSDGIRVVSQRIKDRLRKAGISTSPIKIIPIFIDVKKFTSVSQSEESTEEKSRKVLFAGRLTEEKDVGTLLRAFKKVREELPDTLLEIVGDGPEREKLEKSTEALGVEENVAFEGAVPHDQMPEKYHSCDVFALSSKYEGRGLVLIEAMACCKPVVTTDVGCAREAVIEGETGYIVPVGDSKALAEKVTTILKNPEKGAKMGEKGRQLVTESQDIEKNAHRLKDLYEELKGDSFALVNLRRRY